jgi:hypothetical protein
MVVDERVLRGVYNILYDNINTEVELLQEESMLLAFEHPTMYDTGYVQELLPAVPLDNIMPGFIDIESLMNNKRDRAFPAIAFYIVDDTEERRTISLKTNDMTIQIALFTRGYTNDIVNMRYAGAITNVFEKHDEEIDNFILYANVVKRMFYSPIKFDSKDIRISDITIRIRTEVRYV